MSKLMSTRLLRFSLCLMTVVACTPHGWAADLFTDNFNTDTSGSWMVNASAAAGQQSATFVYDYSAMGIPPAPGSSDTLGLRLRANIPGTPEVPVTNRPAGTTSGLSISPVGQSFGENYVLSFYAWANFFGTASAVGLANNTNSEGGTNNVLAAIGTSGSVPLAVVSTGLATGAQMDGVAFVTTNDGGLADDYRAFAASGAAALATSGVYKAGNVAASTGNADVYYTSRFPAIAAPVVQKTLSTMEFDDGNDAGTADADNTQNGVTAPGAFGFAWRKVVVAKSDGKVYWSINGSRIATVDASSLTLGGSNIALGMSDVNSTTARHPSLLFTVFENLKVSDVLVGDFNFDGAVDGGDFLAWQRGESPTPNSAGDLAAWKTNFGTGVLATSAISAVPEPAAIGLAALAIPVLVAGSRRRGA